MGVQNSGAEWEPKVLAAAMKLNERKHINPYIAELAGITKVLESLPPALQNTQLKVFTSNQSALKAAANPR